MTLRLEWKKKLVIHTDRVKSVDLHPTETWVLSALYNGQLVVYDYNTQSLIKSIEASTQPLRCGKFIARQNWAVCGGDDRNIRVYDYLTLEKVIAFEAHNDYIRSVAVHQTLPLILTSADDLSVKSWNWDQGWARVQTFDSHAHYVMMVAWSPRDPQLFASASLDRTIRIWSIQAPGSNAPAADVSAPHFTLQGHEKGVNSIEYSQSGDKPYLFSASDDCTVRVWDYHTRQCMQVLTGHSKHVCHAVLHPFLPLILAVAEDGHLRVWNSSTYRHETVINYDSGRIWALATIKGSNEIALGTDEGTLVVSAGSDRPVASMHCGKLIFIKGVEVFSTNVRMADEGSIVDGEKLPLPMKEVGSSSVFPQSVSHHPNGRLVAICGDGEYSVLTAQALRNKAYGQAFDLVWAPDGTFAVREDGGRIKVFADFVEVQNFSPAFEVLEIFGGKLLAVKGDDFVCFYDWMTSRLIRRIDVNATGVYWSDSGDFLTITTQDEFYVLSFDHEAVAAAIAANVAETDEGLPFAFDVLNDAGESVLSGLWVEDCFIHVTAGLRLQTFVGGQLETLAFLPRKQYLLGYVAETFRFYLGDREGNITSYKLHLPFLQFQSFVARGEMERAQSVLGDIPKELYDRVARFLVHKGYKELALEYTHDSDYKFDIAVSLGRLELASKQISEMEADQTKHAKVIKSRWKQLADCALESGEFDVARQAFLKGGDLRGLLLMATCLGDRSILEDVQTMAKSNGQSNLYLVSSFLLNDLQGCLNSLMENNRAAEAALFARCYCPSKLSTIMNSWIEDVKGANEAFASRIANPSVPEDKEKFFPDLEAQIDLENMFADFAKLRVKRADKYSDWREFSEFDFVAELKELGLDALRDAQEAVEEGDFVDVDSPTLDDVEVA